MTQLHVTWIFACLASAASAQQEPAGPAGKVYPPGGIGERTVPVAVVVYDPIIETEGGRKLTELMRWQDPDALSDRLVKDIREASGGFVRYEIALRVERDACPPFRSGFR